MNYVYKNLIWDWVINYYKTENRVYETTDIIKLTKPYDISIAIISDTKISISEFTDSTSNVIFNSKAKSGEILNFNFLASINFDFLNSSHIKIKLNNIPLDKFIQYDSLSIRGSYEADKSQLYLGFYKYR